jgi:methylated-DNA-protein-cysteine methyltransferase related protein
MAKSANKRTQEKAKSPQKKISPVAARATASKKPEDVPVKAVSAAKKQKSTEGYERVFEQIYRMVLRIPAGRVMTYGQIARLLDERYSPRLVGWAMHATPKDERNIPWHRVINSRGSTSTGRLILHEPDLQRLLLENEGVVFNDKAVCDLSVFQWSPVQRKTKTKEIGKAPAKTAKAKTAKTGKQAAKAKKPSKTGKKS